ncbi:MAG: TonB family protein [Xanthomonadales bacterium]|nr:TonB family protein [Xanthomonadales bacterium]NIX13962.1 TonB family protein [Xanthomonadales bacterium]
MATTITETFAARTPAAAPRVGIGIVIGFVISLFLFWLMQYMIETADRSLDESSRGSLVDFVRVQRDETIQRRQLKPKKPPPPEDAPPQPPTPQLDSLDPTAEKIAIAPVPVTTDIEMSGGFSLGVGEGDYLPIVKVAPIYPQRALSRGVEGYCVVEYTVTRQGTTRDPRVLEAQCTSSLFHRASLQAALKFKYKPRVIDGEAVEVRGVQNKFTYEITE